MRKGTRHTPEACARIAAAVRAAWTDPNIHARQASPETRTRMAASARAAWAKPEAHARRSAAVTAGRRLVYIDWSELDGPLLGLRASGMAWDAIAYRLGVSMSALWRRVNALGLRHHGR